MAKYFTIDADGNKQPESHGDFQAAIDRMLAENDNGVLPKDDLEREAIIERIRSDASS